MQQGLPLPAAAGGTPAPVVGAVGEHVAAYHGGDVRVEVAEGKGRILVAARDFEPGERILLEYPLVEAAADAGAPAHGLLERLRGEGGLEYAPLFYWAALCTLTAREASGAACRAWPGVAAQTQAQALELHVPEEACGSPSPGTAAVHGALWPDGAGPDPLRLERLLQVWIYNSFDQGAADDPAAAGALYFAASMLSHSCAPNATWHMDEINSFILHSRRAIREDEEITIPYLGPSDLCLPTPDRREALAASKAFHCCCERCAEPHDAARAFACPCCTGGTALAAAETPAGGADALFCAGCGALPPRDVAPLLAVEGELLPWARARYDPHSGPGGAGAAGAGRPALEVLGLAVAGGLAGSHWIVDVARCAAAEEQPDAACDLLRRRVAAHDLAGPHTVSKCARLRVALGDALCKRRDAEALREAVECYGKASEVFALLFGDDHPEHQDTAALRDKAAQTLAKLDRAPKPASTSSSDKRDGAHKSGKHARRMRQ